MPAGWQWGQSPCVQRRALGTVPEWAAGTVPVWSLPSPLRDRNVASPLLRNCGVWWAILYLMGSGDSPRVVGDSPRLVNTIISSAVLIDLGI